MKHIKTYRFHALVLAVVTLLLVGCDALDSIGGGGGGGSDYFESNGQPILADESFQRPHELRLATTGGNQVPANEGDGAIDISNLSDGYVGARLSAGSSALFVVVKTDTGEQNQYSLDTDGSWNFFPLAYGSGSYQFNMYLHLEGTSYSPLLTYDTSVTLTDDKGPFLVNSHVVDYGEGSAAVKLAFELSEHCSDDMEVIRQVFWWICENIEYDFDKANNIESYGSDYVPNLDQILSTKTGICYDYASLAAAMLRANGIPTRMLFGNVNDGDGGTVYHAWNEVWTEQSGWIAVKFEVKGNDWSRVDTTFAATDAATAANLVGDGSNYYETATH